MNKKLIGLYFGWIGVGFYRGCERYFWDFEKNKKMLSQEYQKTEDTLLNVEREIREARQRACKEELTTLEAMGKDSLNIARVERLRAELRALKRCDDYRVQTTCRYAENSLDYEERYGRLRKTDRLLPSYTQMVFDGLGTGLFYGALPFSIIFTTKFELMRAEMWARGITRDDLEKPDNYYFKI